MIRHGGLCDSQFVNQGAPTCFVAEDGLGEIHAREKDGIVVAARGRDHAGWSINL